MTVNAEALRNVLTNYVIMLGLACLLAGVAAIFAALAYEEAKKVRRSVEDWFIKWEERTRAK
jgi:hypothetical protein